VIERGDTQMASKDRNNVKNLKKKTIKRNRRNKQAK
jgi:hypothetical protein